VPDLARPLYATTKKAISIDVFRPSLAANCIICDWHDSVAYACARLLAPAHRELQDTCCCSTGDADAESPFSSASNPLFDEQLAAGRGSALRSPDDGTLCEEADQGGDDALQLRRCDLTPVRDLVMAAACTWLLAPRSEPDLPSTPVDGPASAPQTPLGPARLSCCWVVLLKVPALLPPGKTRCCTPACACWWRR